jgi:hypothetical protein
MIWRKVILAFILRSCLSSSTPADEDATNRRSPASPSAVVSPLDFSKTVVPITELKLLGLGIKGDKVVELYLATGPEDEGATVNDGPLRESHEVHSQSRPGYLRTAPLPA